MNIEEVVEINQEDEWRRCLPWYSCADHTHLNILRAEKLLMNSSINFLQLPALKCCES